MSSLKNFQEDAMHKWGWGNGRTEVTVQGDHMHCRILLPVRLEGFTGHPGRWQLSSFQLQLVLIQLESIFSFKNSSEINIDFYTDIQTQHHVPNAHLHCLLNP